MYWWERDIRMSEEWERSVESKFVRGALICF